MKGFAFFCKASQEHKNTLLETLLPSTDRSQKKKLSELFTWLNITLNNYILPFNFIQPALLF